MKKYTALALTTILAFSSALPFATAMAATNEKAQLRPDISIIFNGVDTNFKTASGSAAYPILYEDSTYLPLRAIGELMGKNVNWDESTKTITISGIRTDTSSTKDNPNADIETIYIQERDDFTIIIDGVKENFYSASGSRIYPILYNGSTYLPLRAIGELMDCSVNWEDSSKTVIIKGYIPDTDDLTVTDADSFGSSEEETYYGYIGSSKAREIALDHAGLRESQVTFIKTALDYDNGTRVYEIEFYSGNKEYDYEINALTGKIVSYDYDIENWTWPDKPSSSDIGAGRAKEIALSDAGLKENQVKFIKASLDYEDGRRIYEVEFYKGNVEYDYEIDASTGKIIKIDNDAEGHYKPNGNSSSSLITMEKAKEIALDRAGLKLSDVRFEKAELDNDDGRKIYELEFRSGRMEYECDIDASTGKIIDFESDYDD